MKFKAQIDGRGMYPQQLVDEILTLRGVKDKEKFLNPSVDDLLPLDSLPNIEEAYEKVMKAVTNLNKIAVYYDIDTDGCCSGTIMMRYLRDLGADAYPVINKGKAHGLIGQSLEPLDEADLVIIVDSLDEDESQYMNLYHANKDIVILDHHMVNPNIHYERYVTLVTSQTSYKNKDLSGAGVVWKFCKYIDDQNGLDYADKYVDLAGIGIVADVMSMKEPENRYIVSQCLQNLTNLACRKIVGSYEFNARGIGFSIAPLINAAQRMKHNEKAVELLLSDDPKEVSGIIRNLKLDKDVQNNYIKEIEKEIQPQLEEQKDSNVICVFTNKQPGLSGLLATSLLGKYNRPVFVLRKQEDENGDWYYRGSLRSPNGLNLTKLVNETKLAEAIGHEQAAGVVVYSHDYHDFYDAISKAVGDVNTKIEVVADVELSLGDITEDMVNAIHKLDYISGGDFPAITVLVRDIDEYEVGQMSNFKHLELFLGDGLEAIQWNTNQDFEEMNDDALLGIPKTFVGTLESGFLRKKFIKKIIISEME